MQKWILSTVLFVSVFSYSQTDTAQVLRAFPITDYIVDLTDSTKIVQIEMPGVVKLKHKQIGILKGVYKNDKKETVQKGIGRCYLIKGDYYYFAIGNNTSGLTIMEGDLIYTFMAKTAIYDGAIPKLATHFIRLKDVYDEPFYDRYLVFEKWTKADEEKIIDSMIRDIKFTGEYFIENDPSIDKPISIGKYAGKNTLAIMKECGNEDLLDFFNYIIARPGVYAGREWKVSEIFATWLSEGAPRIMNE